MRLLVVILLLTNIALAETPLPLVKLQSVRGMQLHDTGEKKQVNVVLPGNDFLELNVPIFAYLPKDGSFLQMKDVVLVRQMLADLELWASLPDLERIQPKNQEKVLRALKLLQAMNKDISTRIDPFMVPAQKETEKNAAQK